MSASHPDDAVLVLGGGGMLASAVVDECRRRGRAVHAPAHGELDLRDGDGVRGALERHRPALVVNCAAFTRVDECETRREHAYEVNGAAVGRLASLAAERGVLLVQVSTDYVFDGRARHPYPEEAATAPINVYGATKLAGERGALEAGALVVRTSWLFGPAGHNFVEAILARARTGEPLRVVDDQVGCPTYTPFLARALLDLAGAVDGRALPQVVHYRNREPVSWYRFARTVLRQWELDSEIEPVPSDAFRRPARRPHYSVLAVERFARLVGREVESWRDGLVDYRERDRRSKGEPAEIAP